MYIFVIIFICICYYYFFIYIFLKHVLSFCYLWKLQQFIILRMKVKERFYC